MARGRVRGAAALTGGQKRGVAKDAEPCAECGFLFSSVGTDNASAAVDGIGPAYAKVLDNAALNSRLRQRRAAKVWSPLEYAAHMRDVLLLFSRRIQVILSQNEPELEVISHDDLVAAGSYNRLNPLVVSEQINDAAQRLAGILNDLAPTDFALCGFRDGEERTILEIAQRAAHESQHHLVDIARGLGA